jgi:formate hydrogenlyase subunit 3/multisubunit Na+/H+ antiporter MnhD subunit
VKTGVLGLHVWLPGSYAEADDEVSGLLSASLSKAAVFALFALVLGSGVPGALALGPWAWRALGWVGLATAMIGALYAIYQEDIKLTLAWSSMGQIGYVVLAFAVMDHAGWTTALYLALNHFLYKSMLFLAIAGVIQRTGTRNMYEMGGLIKKMPLSFLTVLMAIIALSGVPPLSGFGAKWLLYSTLINKGWYLEAAAAFFASGVAFLYLYRLIHSIFLGQPKPEHKDVREAPLALILPQVGLMAVLMAVSVFPSLMLNPIMAIVGRSFSPIFRFAGWTVQSPLGYWNGTLTMVVTGVVFALCLVWMLVNLHNPQSVKQFNIVFAAERPLRPNTTHYAWAFFEPYRDALGFLTRSRAERFWATFGTGINALGGGLRRLYTGNGQTYALHVVIYVVALYFFMGAF